MSAGELAAATDRQLVEERADEAVAPRERHRAVVGVAAEQVRRRRAVLGGERGRHRAAGIGQVTGQRVRRVQRAAPPSKRLFSSRPSASIAWTADRWRASSRRSSR